MRIVFVSNYMNHHQLYLCNELEKRASSFAFVSTDDKYVQGFQYKIKAPYVVSYNEDVHKCNQLILSADVCIIGSSPNSIIDLRMKENKLTFLYTERPFKKGQWRRFILPTYIKIKKRFLQYKEKNLYILCAGSFVSDDLYKVGFPRYKCFKWGYFPETIVYDNPLKIVECKDKNSILWCGRFLDWKHPELVIMLAARLKKEGCNFKIKMYGEGPLKNKLQLMIKKLHLGDYITLNQPLNRTQIRKVMEKTAIFLMTSDKYEGWGVVLNEAMNSGCAVVCGNQVGSASYLIRMNQNGLLFKNNNRNDLYNLVRRLIDNTDLCKSLGLNAMTTILETWNPSAAANNLVMLAQNLINGYDTISLAPDLGPCSCAK